MKIHSLCVVNFKSYFGQHIIGPFNEHFSCIIGPNGNGKSNILDAMLFVFGFKSSKLRQDSLTSLIHSSAFGKPEQAKVSVTFVAKQLNQQRSPHYYSQKNKDNESLQLVAIPKECHKEQSSIIVSRTIRKNNYSFYQLNQKRVQWNELRDFLLKQRIDLQKNLFIILQGEVQRLCELSPQKLVEYIQYVSGSDQYIQKINELQSQYVSGGVQRQRSRQSFMMNKKVYVQQQKQGHELLEHIITRVKLVSLSLIKAKRSKHQNMKQLQDQKKQMDLVEHQLRKKQSQLLEREKQLVSLRYSFQQNAIKISEQQKLTLALNQQKAELQNVEIKKSQSQIQYLVRDCVQKEKQISIIEKEKAQLSSIQNNKIIIQQQSLEIYQLLSSIILHNKNSNPNQKQNKIQRHDSIAKKQPQKSSQQNKIHKTIMRNKKNQKGQQNHQRTSVKSLQYLMSPNPSSNNPLGAQYVLLRNIHKQKQQLEKTKLHLQTQFTKQLITKQTHFKHLSQHLETLKLKYGTKAQLFKSQQEILSAIKLQLRQLSENQQKKQKEIQQITQSLEQIKRRISETEHQKSHLTLSQRIINEIKTANRYNILLPGKKILTLRSVVQIPIDCSHLVNAVTPQLDFLIVQNHNDAREVINFLNNKKLGRISLILFDEVKKIMTGISLQLKGQKPLGCQRIIDLVKAIEKEYEKVLYWAVGNTLIAETVEDAMKAAYHSNAAFRVVSRNGVFIDLSGAMTKVALQSLVVQDRNILETRARVLQKKVEEQRRRMMEIKQQKKQAYRDLNALSSRKSKMGKQQINDNTKSMNQQQAEQFSTRQQLAEFMQSLSLQIQQLQKQISNIRSNRANLELDIKLKQKQINDDLKQVKDTLPACIENKLTIEEVLQLVQQYENLLLQLKKSSISAQVINSHQEKIHKLNQQISAIKAKISAKQSQQQTLKLKVSEKLSSIKLNQQNKRKLMDENQSLQQKIFIKQIDIKTIQGQNSINHQGKQRAQSQIEIFQNSNINNKKVKNNKNRIHEQEKSENGPNQHKNNMPLKNKQKNNKYKKDQQQDMKTLIDKETLPKQPQLSTFNNQQKTIQDIRSKHSQLKNIINKKQLQIKKNQKNMNTCLSALKNLYSFFNKKFKQKNKQMQNYHQRQQQKSMPQQISPIEQNQDQQMKNNLVSFSDIINDFFQKHSQNLNNQQNLLNSKKKRYCQENKSFLVELLNQKQRNEQDKRRSSLTLKNMLRHQLDFESQFQKDMFDKIIGSFRIAYLQNEGDLNLTDLLSKQQLSLILSIKNGKCAIKKEKEQQEMRVDILEYLSEQKLNYWEGFYTSKLKQIETNSCSLLLKNMQKSPLRSQHDSIRIRDEQNAICYFTDEQFPLESWQEQILDELARKKGSFLFSEKKLSALQNKLKIIYSQLLQIRQLRTSCYLNTFNMINFQVNKIYHHLTKGNAEINLINSINPFEGLQFSVRPFNKTWKSVNLLSGGEKTLTSLALIFACEEIKKFPFYFMDEIDAALDFKNVTNLGKYIKEKKNVQHIVISLRKNMYEQSDQLVCLYKVNDITRTIVVNMKQLYGRRKVGQKKQRQKQKQKQNEKRVIKQSRLTMNSQTSCSTITN